MKELFKMRGGELFKYFDENIISFDLFGLKVTFLFWAQFEIFKRSLFSCEAVIDGSLASKVVSYPRNLI